MTNEIRSERGHGGHESKTPQRHPPPAGALVGAPGHPPVSRIATALGVTEQGLIYHARKLGLAPRTKIKCVIDVEEFRAMWEFGVARQEMAAHFGYSRVRSVGVTAQRLRLEKRKPGGKSSPIAVAQCQEWQIGRQISAAHSDAR